MNSLKQILRHIRPWLSPTSQRGYPPNDLEPEVFRQIQAVLGRQWKEVFLSRTQFTEWVEGLGDFSRLGTGPAPGASAYLDYEKYPGPLLLPEKLFEHWATLHLLQLQPGQTLIDIGSAASPFPAYVREALGLEAFSLDPDYPPGIHGFRIGAFAQSIPLPAESVDGLVLHCALDHFEGTSDTDFMAEAARVLRPGGKLLSLPLYLSHQPANLCDPQCWKPGIGFDSEARIHWVLHHRNRFGRIYSPQTYLSRLQNPAQKAGLQVQLLRFLPIEGIVPNSYLRYGFLASKPD